MKAEKDEEAIEERFEANSDCWFKLITSAEIEVVTSYPEDLAQIINEGSYTKLQIFKILQINSLYWQKIPSRTLITKEKKSMPGFKTSKDKLILLLGANSVGDFKLRQCSFTILEILGILRIMLIYSASRLNNKTQMTTHLFTTWFTEYFKPTVETLCS